MHHDSSWGSGNSKQASFDMIMIQKMHMNVDCELEVSKGGDSVGKQHHNKKKKTLFHNPQAWHTLYISITDVWGISSNTKVNRQPHISD